MASRDCGWCGRLVHFEAASALLVAPYEWPGSFFQSAYLCPNCHHMNIATEGTDERVGAPSFGSHDDAQTHQWGSNVQWLPHRRQSREFPDVPRHIAEAATEVTLCLSMKAYRAVGSVARAVVEATAMIRTRRAETSPLESTRWPLPGTSASTPRSRRTRSATSATTWRMVTSSTL
jgi:hypothetical protein